MTYIGPTDGNLDALRRREEEHEAWLARFQDCPECNSTGEVYVQLDGRDGDPNANYDEQTCDHCGGSGEVERDDWEEEE